MATTMETVTAADLRDQADEAATAADLRDQADEAATAAGAERDRLADAKAQVERLRAGADPDTADQLLAAEAEVERARRRVELADRAAQEAADRAEAAEASEHDATRERVVAEQHELYEEAKRKIIEALGLCARARELDRATYPKVVDVNLVTEIRAALFRRTHQREWAGVDLPDVRG